MNGPLSDGHVTHRNNRSKNCGLHVAGIVKSGGFVTDGDRAGA